MHAEGVGARKRVTRREEAEHAEQRREHLRPVLVGDAEVGDAAVFVARLAQLLAVADDDAEQHDAGDREPHDGVAAREERGRRLLAHRARALDVIKLPDSMSTSLTAPSRTTTPLPAANDDRSVSVPVMGRIAAGTPIEALQEEINQISVPMEMMRSGEHYALEVHGDSMIDAGIFDGDTAIIQSGNTAENGEIIVALVEGHEATLKRLRRKGEMIALEAANASYETRIFRSDQIRVQGRLVGLIRKY